MVAVENIDGGDGCRTFVFIVIRKFIHGVGKLRRNIAELFHRSFGDISVGIILIAAVHLEQRYIRYTLVGVVGCLVADNIDAVLAEVARGGVVYIFLNGDIVGGLAMLNCFVQGLAVEEFDLGDVFRAVGCNNAEYRAVGSEYQCEY